MNPMGIVFILAGLFSIAGAALDWDWFMNHRKARFFCALCGRGGARVLYGIIGLALIFLGALMALGIVQNSHHFR